MGKSRSKRRSACPIANSLDILGDRWSLVIIRDLMFRGKREYGELLDSEEGISPVCWPRGLSICSAPVS